MCCIGLLLISDIFCYLYVITTHEELKNLNASEIQKRKIARKIVQKLLVFGQF